ncbi:MAG: flagellar biosynthesis protein FlhB [Candidatus Cloacimonetes bacterium]|nr:flagellar biosynthesis protein FlhB [Candidatus Cloacimonadota bacterium]
MIVDQRHISGHKLNQFALELDSLDLLLPLNLTQFEESAGEKTEEPTDKRKADARKKGNIPKSEDLNSAINLMILTIFVYMMLPRFYGAVGDMFNRSLRMFEVQEMTANDMWIYFLDIILYWYLIMGPLFFVVIILTMTVQISQVGINFSTESMTPDLQRFNPVNGMKKIIGKQALVELAKSLIKLVILGYFPYKMFINEYPTMTALFGETIGHALDYIAWLMVRLIIEMGLVLVIYGLFDLMYQKWKTNEDLKMSKQEVKEERKQTDGDPQVKAKIRQKQMEMAQGNMMSEVPKADVVVTNPTHFAVALKYDRESGFAAPVVVAKGQNIIAHKIKEIARENDVPIIEDKPLARALYRQVGLNQEISETLFAAAAEVLAKAFKIKRKTFRP